MTRQGLLKQIQRRNEPLHRIAKLEKKLETAKKILKGLVDGVVLYSDNCFKAAKAEAEEFLKEEERNANFARH